MSSIKETVMNVIDLVDYAFGEGYAKKNPELIGRLVQAELSVVGAGMIQDGLYFLGSDIDDEPNHIM